MQYRRPRFDPWVGKIPWRREWLPTPVFLPGSFHGQRNLVGYSPFFFNYKDVGDRKMSSLPPKNVHFLIHGSCKCVTIHKRVGCCCGNNQRCSILALKVERWSQEPPENSKARHWILSAKPPEKKPAQFPSQF